MAEKLKIYFGGYHQAKCIAQEVAVVICAGSDLIRQLPSALLNFAKPIHFLKVDELWPIKLSLKNPSLLASHFL